MKLTIAMLMLGMGLGTAFGQNLDLIENTRNTMKAVEKKKEIDSNAALAASQGQSARVTPALPAKSNGQPTAPAKAAPVTAQKAPVNVQKPMATAQKQAVKPAPAVKPVTPPKASAVAEKRGAARKPTIAAAKQKTAPAKQKVAVQDRKNPVEAKKDAPRVINITGKRDPFLSPVVSHTMTGSGCSSGKKCLAIDQISLRGVVRSDNGMIAVVVNALDKAYFLHENDPVFNGYVVKITGDSVVFKETLQDKLGKPFTREVTKKINTPAV